jgi:hypothetical protein
MKARIAAGLTAVLLLAAPAAQVHAQAQEDAAIATLRASLSASAFASFSAIVRDAQRQGLPTQPLIAKAREGTAKNVPDDRIVAAVRQTAEFLGRARALLRAAAALETEAEISAAATALQRGVPADAVSRLAADARGRGSVGLSAHVLADIMGHGVPMAAGIEMIAAWRGHGADPARLNEIPAAVERLVRQGVVPARAAAGIGAGLRLGRSPGSITPAEIPRLIRG